MVKTVIHKSAKSLILVINGGSSSIKFALYDIQISPKVILSGTIDRIGLKGTQFIVKDPLRKQVHTYPLKSSDYKSVIQYVIQWIEKNIGFDSIQSVGHRVVHGMKHTEPEPITQKLLHELNRIRSYDPDHLLAEIEIIEIIRKDYPKLFQVACFDTTFHSQMPRVAKLLPIPRRFNSKGIQRYGFHGISYAYLMEELKRIAGAKSAKGRVILAHLGSGASIAAVRNGKSKDTSMGFTPCGGLVMGTRPGDIDPGVAWFMMKTEKLSPQGFNQIINQESGLLGISETSSDMRDLLKRQKRDIRAREAIGLFCYQTRKWIGAFTTVLGGLDTLVFSGGIGEKAPEIRERICKGLEFLGLEINKRANAKHSPVISSNKSKVIVRVIPTNEELMITKIVYRLLHNKK